MNDEIKCLNYYLDLAYQTNIRRKNVHFVWNFDDIYVKRLFSGQIKGVYADAAEF